MELKEIRISVSEMLEICSYAIGKNEAEALKQHWHKYGNYTRLKDLLLKSIILKNKERSDRITRLQKRNTELELQLQTDFFLPQNMSRNFSPSQPAQDNPPTNNDKAQANCQ